MKLILPLFLIIALFSCKPTLYTGTYGHINQTQVTLSESNFEVLGSYSGVATTKKKIANIKEKQGLIAEAKANLIEQAKQDGVEMNGSKAFINITVDVVENFKRATATVTAEIIEFK